MKKETIELVKKMIEDGNLSPEIAEKYCPELVESEDEKIRKELIKYFSEGTEYLSLIPYNKERCIAWLEKQGENSAKNIVEAWKDMRLEVYQQASGNRHEPNYSDDTTKMFSLNDIDEIIEKISEQNPTEEYNITGIGSKNAQGKLGEMIKKLKPVNEILEQKFKVGDLITNGILIGKIDEINEHGYHAYFGDHYADVPDVENWHKWTIQDAKEGDVLSWDDSKCIAIFKNIYDEDSFNSYGFVGGCTGTFESRQSYHDIEGTHPATKEQRDLLFQKMKEAGYEWDADKKELKKIEQKPKKCMYSKDDYTDEERKVLCNSCEEECELRQMKNTVWSKEDEERINSILSGISYSYSNGHYLKDTYQKDINWLKSLKDRVQLKQEWSEEDEKILKDIITDVKFEGYNNDMQANSYKKINWLKSLRLQNMWKPTREQIEALQRITQETVYTKDIVVVQELTKQLKAL